MAKYLSLDFTENPDFSSKNPDYLEVMSDLAEEDEVDCHHQINIPTNSFSFASSNGAASDSTEYYYEEDLELKLEKPKSHDEVVIIEEVTLPIKIESESESESESDSESDTDSSTSSSELHPSINIVEVTDLKECEGKFLIHSYSSYHLRINKALFM